MQAGPSLYWLPEAPDWRERLKALRALPPGSAAAWDTAMALARTRLDFVATNALDAALRALFAEGPPAGLATRPVRLAVLSTSTTAQLHPAIRVGALRRGIHLTLYETAYGQWWQELLDPASGLHAFRPDAVLFALDAHHLAAGAEAGMEAHQAEAALAALLGRLEEAWRRAAALCRGPVLQQTALPVFPTLLGSNEARLPGAPAAFLARLNAELPARAAAAGVDLLDLAGRAARDGLAAWHSAPLWHRAKQEVAPPAAPFYGDLVARLLAARQGLAAKCLVLDLDNTLWGGVIGDDGLAGIGLGQGSAEGEAFLTVQAHARALAARGVLLAVCSKNDAAVAAEPFAKHPEMLLREADIACFVANWEDKPANLRRIAQALNIGLDALVLLDDNPFERALVRRELPMVAVPELPEEPALYPAALADAGYFEGVAVTAEDRARGAQYRGNAARAALAASTTDLAAYLRELEMRLLWRRFDAVGLPRIVQLINKTNQFNLTTRRYTEAEAAAVMQDKQALGLQFRLLDRFGDNGVIAILIGRLGMEGEMAIDTWLMSCRVLGREVEQACLAVLAAEARRMGARRLRGTYRPTAKNGMVRDHYPKLGFTPLAAEGEALHFALALEELPAAPGCMRIEEG
ncbi:HAD-IIIC family phosphatase [Siccirubricoccus sp. KC 17139]|uniref:HAD-IIIC family phosphatase n=1 Tax=Siccirubricoccus soli TaxID=2899147 RepID=A0ABT1D785_9PROT|nr:HAD-IIIC family phosphatase [Siccirubricoccus soli]MCO6417783.1 HAD-IIIC family phosphatase [Siccirubricoccus soli]MCP2683918.1 HAD-IIIC family phosphatase [Siccirubricoccus soli]